MLVNPTFSMARSIPAGAGEPGVNVLRQCLAQVYPRGCGGAAGMVKICIC